MRYNDEITGLKSGIVKLLPHQSEWDLQAEQTIFLLKSILGDACIDVQHIGSTAIKEICAKPIIDIALAVNELADAYSYTKQLAQNGILYRKAEETGQLLFIMGNLDEGIKTHHIHVVRFNSGNWTNYINFRDYLNTFPAKAKEYNKLKLTLAEEYYNNRKAYTVGKKELIERLLNEARLWRETSAQQYK